MSEVTQPIVTSVRRQAAMADVKDAANLPVQWSNTRTFRPETIRAAYFQEAGKVWRLETVTVSGHVLKKDGTDSAIIGKYVYRPSSSGDWHGDNPPGWVERFAEQCNPANLVDNLVGLTNACDERGDGVHAPGSRLMTCWACNAQ